MRVLLGRDNRGRDVPFRKDFNDTKLWKEKQFPKCFHITLIYKKKHDNLKHLFFIDIYIHQHLVQFICNL